MDASRSTPTRTRAGGSTDWQASDPARVPITVISNAEKRLAAGEYARAVSDAYHRVVLDLQKAYGLSLPAQWTHREFLSDFLREDMGILTTLVARLYRMYEPVRYGSESDWVKGDLVELLSEIYAEPPMKNLYRTTPLSAPRGADPSSAPPRSPAGVEGLPETLQ